MKNKTMQVRFINLLGIFLITACNTSTPQTTTFSLQLASGSLSIKQGETGTLEISLNKTGGFNVPVSLSISGLPTGVSASFDPTIFTDKSNLTVSVATDATVQELDLSISGVAGTLSRSTSFTLSITATTPDPDPNPDPDDKTGPILIRTQSTGNTSVEVSFNEAIVGGSNPANFTIFPDLKVLAASVSADAKTVTLRTASQTENESYALLVSTTITDLAGNPFDRAATDPFATNFTGTVLGRAECTITAPPASLGLDPFYTKFCALKGIPIIAFAEVPDAALQEAAEILHNMLVEVSDRVVDRIVANKTRVGIIGVNQVTTDMPEYRNLDRDFPLPDGESWDTRARGLGATPFIPLASGAEENILCYEQDPYKGESILLHEFAHTVLDMGVNFTDPGFRPRLDTAYQAALAAGLWENTYAAETLDEYWAEGVQTYFNNNLEAIPADGVHNEINTRTELESYDTALFGLIQEIFGERDWTSVCP